MRHELAVVTERSEEKDVVTSLPEASHHDGPDTVTGPLAVVGRGRLGTAMAGALRSAGVTVKGPLGREPDVGDARVVLLCVSDGAIADVAADLPGGLVVGHCCGAMTLDVLAPHECFSLHPFMTIPRAVPTRFAGSAAAVAGTTPRALAIARTLALHLDMRPITVADRDRTTYHASGSVAANFLVTVLGLAEDLAATIGLDRSAYLPLVEAAVHNWAQAGATAALTGPVARGDTETVQRQRLAVRDHCPQALDLFDALVVATQQLAGKTNVME